jgi:ubiquinone/menaquinone biosynthesis C-methylase UbiE
MQNPLESNRRNPASDWNKRHQEGWGDEKQPKAVVLKFFEGLKGKAGTVLDIACGSGRYVVPFAQMGFQVSGVDFSSAGLSDTKRKLDALNLSASLQEGSFHSLPYPDNSFDTAFSSNAFNRNDWKGAKLTFKETRRILKPGGIFYLVVSSSAEERPKKDGEVITIIEEPIDPEVPVENRGTTFSKKREGYEEPKMHNYSKEELEALAKYAGLEVVEGPTEEGHHWHIVFKKIL